MRKTKLDAALFELLDTLPEGITELTPEEARMAEHRRRGDSLAELAVEFHLTSAGVRLRLYGCGRGLRRGGGILGKLRAKDRRRQNDLRTA